MIARRLLELQFVRRFLFAARYGDRLEGAFRLRFIADQSADAEIERCFRRRRYVLKRARLTAQVDRRSIVVLGWPLNVDDHALALRSAGRIGVVRL